MIDLLSKPWPWYVSGPLIGLMIPLLLVLGNKPFGISSSLRHVCAACIPGNIKFFQYDWKSEKWNVIFAIGVIIGGFIAGFLFPNSNPVKLSVNTIANINSLGIKDTNGLVPIEIFNIQSVFTLRGFVLLIVGAFLVGFGTRYSNGCTSGHSIMGLSNLQLSSFIATICFFAGGLIMTWFVLPLIMTL